MVSAILRPLCRAWWLLLRACGLAHWYGAYGVPCPWREAVAQVAMEACERATAGDTYWHVGWHTFSLQRGGRCSTFCRQCHEVAAGAEPFTWRYWDLRARWVECRLRRGAVRVDAPEPGDVVCMGGVSGKAGRIGLFVGDGFVVHAGSEGVELTLLADLQGVVTGYYRA